MFPICLELSILYSLDIRLEDTLLGFIIVILAKNYTKNTNINNLVKALEEYKYMATLTHTLSLFFR